MKPKKERKRGMTKKAHSFHIHAEIWIVGIYNAVDDMNAERIDTSTKNEKWRKREREKKDTAKKENYRAERTNSMRKKVAVLLQTN